MHIVTEIWPGCKLKCQVVQAENVSHLDFLFLNTYTVIRRCFIYFTCLRARWSWIMESAGYNLFSLYRSWCGGESDVSVPADTTRNPHPCLVEHI